MPIRLNSELYSQMRRTAMDSAKSQFRKELKQHSDQFDEAQRDVKYGRDRRTRLFPLGASERNLNVFRYTLLEALDEARTNNHKLPIVIVKHAVKDRVDSVNADLLLGFLEPYMFQYALLIDFNR